MCEPINEVNSLRPPVKEEDVVRDVIVVVFWVTIILISIGVTFIYKNHPMFFKIRSFHEVAINNIMICCSITATILPHTTDTFPCWLDMYVNAFNAGMIIATFSMRGLMYITESEHTKKVSLYEEPDGSPQEPPNTRSYLRLCLELGSLRSTISDFSIEELISLRRNKLRIIAIMMIIPNIFTIISVLIVDKFRLGCTGCPTEWEYVVIILGPTAPGAIFTFRIMFLALINKYPDTSYIKTEMMIILTFTLPFIYIGYTVDILDPGNLQRDRIFSWRYVNAIAPFMLWTWSCFIPILIATFLLFKKKKDQTRSRGESTKGDLLDVLNRDPVMKNAFNQHMVNRLCAENMNFMLDVRRFKTKPTQAEYRRIYSLYIESGVAPQEVNISFEMRKRIIPNQDIGKSFDESYNEILHMTTTGPWNEFLMLEKKKKMIASKTVQPFKS